jgi:hypothetical protein
MKSREEAQKWQKGVGRQVVKSLFFVCCHNTSTPIDDGGARIRTWSPFSSRM